jgi:alpha-L-rhamnosidase
MVMVDRGATTVWEEWEGVDAEGRPHASLNHYSKGAVIGFLHRHTAGIEAVEPAYRRFRIRPRPGGGLTWAAAHHDGPHGRIESRWEVLDLDGPGGDGGHQVTVTVPPGATCELVLPDGTVEDLGVGTHTRRSGPASP